MNRKKNQKEIRGWYLLLRMVCALGMAEWGRGVGVGYRSTVSSLRWPSPLFNSSLKQLHHGPPSLTPPSTMQGPLTRQGRCGEPGRATPRRARQFGGSSWNVKCTHTPVQQLYLLVSLKNKQTSKAYLLTQRGCFLKHVSQHKVISDPLHVLNQNIITKPYKPNRNLCLFSKGKPPQYSAKGKFYAETKAAFTFPTSLPGTHRAQGQQGPEPAPAMAGTGLPHSPPTDQRECPSRGNNSHFPSLCFHLNKADV